MARHITGPDGATWEVALSGRRTQYGSDEVSLEFRRVAGGGPERRYVRFAPGGEGCAELAFDLVNLVALHNPWPVAAGLGQLDGGYASPA